ncbi:hypothetical protein SK128_019864 [Halocaridina rubra]|uniref:Alpha-glucosidase n=1 Tax=Halocaridina rubra TaxID=373956 RepID=A0AAN9A037_HALRR
MRLLVFFSLSLLLNGAHSQDLSTSIECPFPEGQDVASENECAKYSACAWTDGVCHMRSNAEAGYAVKGQSQSTERGFKMSLEKIDRAMTLYGTDVMALVFEVIYHEDYHVQIKLYDALNPRYEVPVPLTLPEAATENPLFVVTTSAENQPFQFKVERLGGTSGDQLFQSVGAITFEDQFLQITTTLSSTYFYGMGENTHSTLKHMFSPRDTFPIFARDHLVAEGHLNEYGHHPYYIVVNNNTGDVHSVLLFSSNGVEYSTFLLEDGTPALTLRTIGGIVDLHIFLGPTLEDVNQQYSKMVGFPAFPPYWTLGFHIARWGYANTTHVREVRERTKAMGIPQDGQTLDIDYMYRNRDFTYDPVDWADLPDLLQELHNDDLKVTLILDPALVVDWDNYPPGQRGKDADVYLKWLSSAYIPEDQDPSWNDYMVGRVWPDLPVVFPDFLNPVTQRWWADELILFRQNVSYDAIWIDMNEPSNFGTNLNEFQHDLMCPNNTWDTPPYPTKMVRVGPSLSRRISAQTVCMSGNQTDGNEIYLHYDVHSLYGWSETVATYKGLQEVLSGKRPVILSRSTFVGSGQYTAHWLGDNSALWNHLKFSVIGMLEFNFFGIPMVGSDICGFNLTPGLEMCARWMELGAFYPFSRNHNMRGMPDQDPGMWPEVAAISRDILLLRYQYLPYLYTLFYESHTSGSSVVRPLFSEHPKDSIALEVDDQFLWGKGIMVAPVLAKGVTERDVYFPEGKWYDLNTGVEVAEGPLTLTVPAPLEIIPVYAAGGVVLPYQEPAITTVQSRNNPFGLTVALNSSLQAEGRLFWDDGESVYVEEDTYLANITFANNILRLEVQRSTLPVTGLTLETLRFFGYPSSPAEVEVNGSILDPGQWSYDDATNVLTAFISVLLSENLTVMLL